MPAFPMHSLAFLCLCRAKFYRPSSNPDNLLDKPQTEAYAYAIGGTREQQCREERCILSWLSSPLSPWITILSSRWSILTNHNSSPLQKQSGNSSGMIMPDL